MRTEQFFTHSRKWLEDRPSLAKQQLENPLFSLRRAQDEIAELVDALEQGLSRDEIMGELTDVFNFLATAEYILFKQFGFTEDELVDRSRTIYQVSHAIKYDPRDFQNGEPPEVSIKRSVNNWELAKIYQGSGFNLNPEYY